MAELIELARSEKIAEIAGDKKHDLIFKILKERVKLNGLMFGEGTLEILPDGFGFCGVLTITTWHARTTFTSHRVRYDALVFVMA